MSATTKPVKKNWFARHWILTTLLVLFILWALGSGGQTPPPASAKVDAPKQEEKKVEEPKNKPEITMEEFTAIKNGMTYKQVTEIVWSEWEVLSESEMAGYKTIMYQFKGNTFGGNANVTIQNDKVAVKAQFWLK